MVTLSIPPLYPWLYSIGGWLGGVGKRISLHFQAGTLLAELPRLIIRKLLFSSSTCEITEISGRGSACKAIFSATLLANVEKYAILFHFSTFPCLNRRGKLMPVAASKLVFHYSPLMYHPVDFNFILFLATCLHPFGLDCSRSG